MPASMIGAWVLQCTLLFATFGRPDNCGDVDIYLSRLEGGKFGTPVQLP